MISMAIICFLCRLDDDCIYVHVYLLNSHSADETSRDHHYGGCFVWLVRVTFLVYAVFAKFYTRYGKHHAAVYSPQFRIMC